MLCRDGLTQSVIVEDTVVTRAKRFPMIVAAKCGRKHNLLLFVMKDLRVVDVQEALSDQHDKTDIVDRTRGYFESF